MSTPVKISALPVATQPTSVDTHVIVQSGVTRRVPHSLVLDSELAGWRDFILTTDFAAAPTLDRWTGSVFTPVAAWVLTTAQVLGDYRKPTVANGYVYECVTAGTTAAGEPVWGTQLGADTLDGTVYWRCRGPNVITTNSDLTGMIGVGSPLRYTYGGTAYFGMCIGISTSRIAVAGAPMVGTSNLTALAYAGRNRLMQYDLYIPGVYAATAADKLDSIGKQLLRWGLGAARLIRFRVRNKTIDSGANQPKVNVKVGGSAVSRNDTDKGPTVAATWVENSSTAIHVSNYAVAYGADIEVAVTAVGSTLDAADLVVSLILVLE